MRDAIIEKVKPYLAKAPTNECEVVYVLAELRKLLERDGNLDRFGRLRFFCDWALHAKLTRSQAKRIIEDVNKAIEERESGKTAADVAAEHLYNLVTLEAFKRDLANCLHQSGLPLVWTTGEWRDFVSNYFAIIKDCALEISNPAEPGACLIQKVVLTASVGLAKEDPHLDVVATWELTFANISTSSKTFTMNLWKDGKTDLAYWD